MQKRIKNQSKIDAKSMLEKVMQQMMIPKMSQGRAKMHPQCRKGAKGNLRGRRRSPKGELKGTPESGGKSNIEKDEKN